MSKKTYIALEPLNVNGKPVAVDGSVELTDEQAEQPLALNAIKLADAAPSGGSSAPEGQERIDAIKAAIAGLNVDVADNWAKDGKPKADVISKVTGWAVTAAERDAIWSELHPAPAA